MTEAQYQSRIGNIEVQGREAIMSVRNNTLAEARNALNAQSEQMGLSNQNTIQQARTALLRQQNQFQNEIGMLRNEYSNFASQAQGNLAQSNAEAEALQVRLRELEHQSMVQS